MKRFQFSLQAVLTLRQREEQKAMEAYARELLSRQQALARLAEVEADLDHARAEIHKTSSNGCAIFKLAQAQLSYRKLSERRDLCARQLSEAERRVNAALNAMLARRQQRRIVDKHYEKRRAEYDRDLIVIEQKESDELARSGRLGALTGQFSIV